MSDLRPFDMPPVSAGFDVRGGWVGTRFGRLVIIAVAEPAYRANGGIRRRSLCRCNCGAEKVVRDEDLRSGNTRSCGCLFKEEAAKRQFKHGQAHTPTYQIWVEMKQRCHNPNDGNFSHYGARGIKVCAVWRENYEIFVCDMGLRPKGMSIDRIDNDGDYEPRNCRWATRLEQGANMRSNVVIEWGGETMIMAEAIRRAGLPPKAVAHRIKRGWPLDKALTTALRGAHR